MGAVFFYVLHRRLFSRYVAEHRDRRSRSDDLGATVLRATDAAFVATRTGASTGIAAVSIATATAPTLRSSW